MQAEALEPRLALAAEVEPNDTLAQATLFGTANETLTGRIASLGDLDYFQVALGQGDRISATFRKVGTFDPEIVGGVELLDDAGRVLSTKVVNIAAEAIVPKAGTYYVRTWAPNDYGTFTGNYSLGTIINTFTGTTESEPNNTTGTADSLSSGANFRGELTTAGDLDYFSFNGTTGQTVSIGFANLPGESPTAIIYRPDGTELGRGNAGVGVQLSLPVSGSYRLVVSSALASGTFVGQYVGRLNLASSPVTVSAAATSFDTAAAVTLGSSTVNVVGLLSAVNAPKFLRFDVTTLNQSSVSFSSLPYNVKLTLFNERGQIVDYRHGTTVNTTTADFAFTAGRYYVSIQAQSEAGLGPFQVGVARSTAIPTQRDVPLYFIDLTAQKPTHQSYAWVAPFGVPAASSYIQGLFESRYDAWDVDVTQLMPAAGVEHVSQGYGNFGNIGAGGYGSGGFGTRRPSGTAVTSCNSTTWTSISYGCVNTLNHEFGHATGLAHARSVQAVMGYVNDDELFPVGSSYLFPGTDSLVPSTYKNNPRDYLDWAFQAGRQVIEVEPNNSSGTAVNLDTFLNEMRADADVRNDRVVVFGRIEDASDLDRYRFTATAGETFSLDIEAAEFQYPLDAVLSLFDSSGNLLASSDDALDRDTGVTSVDPYLTHTFAVSGTYHVQVSSKLGTAGHYRLKLTPDAAQDRDGPKVIGTWPAGQSTAKTRRQIILYMNDQVDPATLTSTNIIVQGNTSGVRTGTAIFDPFESVFVWTADANLPIDAYTVTLVSGTTGIHDLKGNQLDGETDGTFVFPEVSGDGTPGGNFSFNFTVNANDTTAASVSATYSRGPYSRGRFSLSATDELSLASVASAQLIARGAGPDATFNTADDRILPLDVMQDWMNHRNSFLAFTRGIPDPDRYRIEGTIRDNAGFTINLSSQVNVASEVPESALFVSSDLSQMGLVGSYVNASLRSYSTQDDWRVSQPIAGTRTDPTIDFATGDFGIRAEVGITGGSDANWDNFSVQWDGYLQVPAAGTRMLLRSSHGSRLWIDLNNDGIFNTSGVEFVSNSWGSTGSTTGTLSTAIAAAGTYRIRVQYEHVTGSEQAYLEWLTPDIAGRTEGIGHGPSVINTSIQPGSVLAAADVDSVDVFFSGAINPATLTLANFKVRYSPDARFYNGNDSYLTESDGVIAWNAAQRKATFQSSQPLQHGHYLLELNGDAGGIADNTGKLLDGEYLDSYIAGNVLPMQWQNIPSGDGVAGGDYVAAFSVSNFSVSVGVSPASVLEDGASHLVYTFTRSGELSTAATVNFSVGGSATFNADYSQSGAATFTATMGAVTFAAGSATATVTIDPSADTELEPDETVVLTITANSAYSLGPTPSAIGTIQNDEPLTFQVDDVVLTSTGFIVEFNRDLDVANLNLYDLEGSPLGAADVTFVGATVGNVRGSVVIDPNLRRLTFIRTTGLLAPDLYTLRLRSAANGFRDAGGGLLDGDANGTAGGDFVQGLTVTAPPLDAVTVSLPNFARGPRQSVNFPANSTDGLPLSFSDGQGISSASLQILYDPALLEITGAIVAPGLPVGANVLLNTSTPGVAIIQFTSPRPLPAGTKRFVDLQASVPETALYRSKQVLTLAEVSLNGGDIPALADHALQVLAYFGDTTGNGSYNAQDASRISRVGVGLDGGFEPYTLLDPVLIGDVTGNGSITAADTSRMLQVSVGFLTAEVPPLPIPAISITQGGPDPKLSIPNDLVATAGGRLSIPVLIDSIVDLTGNGLESADLVIFYDAAALEVTSVQLGDLLASSPGSWMVAANIDSLAGRIIVSMAGTQPLAGFFLGELVRLQATVKETAAPGASAINLAAGARDPSRFTQLNEGYLTLIPAPTDGAHDPGVDGSILILPGPSHGMPRPTVEQIGERLVVTGTAERDHLVLGLIGPDLVRVRVGRWLLGDFARPSSITLQGFDGSDTVTVGAGVPLTGLSSGGNEPASGRTRASTLTEHDLALLQWLDGQRERATKPVAGPRRLQLRP